MQEIEWSHNAKEIFSKVIGTLPQFHRSIAERLVKESAQDLARSRGSQLVQEEDLIRAFFQEVPPAFKGMMKRLFQRLRIDYSQFVQDALPGAEDNF
jgi:hypothetical protein